MFMLIYCRVLRLFGLGSSIWEVMLYNAIRCYHALSAHHSNLRVVMHYNATRCCHALQCNTVLSCITMPARCDGITKQSWFRIPMTMLLSTSATRFCYAVTAALPIMCCLATAQHAVKRKRSTVLRHHQQNEDVDITKHHNGTAHLCYATMMNSRLT